MYEEGEEIWVDVGALRKRWRRKVWKKGVIVRKYDNWYLIEIKGKYRIGSNELDIKRELSERDLEKSEVEE